MFVLALTFYSSGCADGEAGRINAGLIFGTTVRDISSPAGVKNTIAVTRLYESSFSPNTFHAFAVSTGP